MKAMFGYLVAMVFAGLLVMSFYTLFSELATVQTNVRVMLSK